MTPTPEEARAVAIALQGYGHNVPKPVTPEWIKTAEGYGMIRRADLIHRGVYVGCCRNTYVAKWNEEDGVFWHLRTKMSRVPTTFAEKINHVEDDDGYDVFVPTLLLFEDGG